MRPSFLPALDQATGQDPQQPAQDRALAGDQAPEVPGVRSSADRPPSPPPTPTAEAGRRGREAVSARQEQERRGRKYAEALNAGWLLYRDTLPGTGYVLAGPSLSRSGALLPGGTHRLRFHRTRQEALDRYHVLQAEPLETA
jgi:hypothetical protein